MSEPKVETLAEYLRTHKPKGFKAVPHYFVDGDFLTLYFEDADAYAESLNDHVDLYRAMDDKRIVGVKLFGVRNLVETPAREAVGA